MLHPRSIHLHLSLMYHFFMYNFEVPCALQWQWSVQVGRLHVLPAAVEGKDSTQDDVSSLEELGLLWLPH